MSKFEGILLDADYKTIDDYSVIRTLFKDSKSKEKKIVFFPEFKPFFYAIPYDKAEAAKKEIEESSSASQIHKIIIEKKTDFKTQKELSVLKIEAKQAVFIRELREKIPSLSSVKEVREADIPFSKRFLINKQLEPFKSYELTLDDSDNAIEIKEGKEFVDNLIFTAVDLETLSPGRFSDPLKDSIIMSSIYSGNSGQIFCTKKVNRDFAVKVFDEKELLEKTIKKITELKTDILVTYNGDSFDLPYIKDRAPILKADISFGTDSKEPISIRSMGIDNGAKIKGLQHLDAYKVVKILNRFATINLIKFDLESVSEKLFGKTKEKVSHEDINEIWASGKGLERLADYNLEDSKVTLEVAERFSSLFIELSKLIKQSLFDVSRSSASLLVEYLLINESFKKNLMVPNNPSDREVKERMNSRFEGGFVLEPKSGLHEDIAILDFSSLHPTIMISHNISPDAVDCGHEKCIKENTAPNEHHFCMEKKGFLSSLLENLFDTRIKLKKSLKTLKKDSVEYKITDARQHSLKIILNSFYGTLGYPRFRWYSGECASAVTAFSRKYVKMVALEADKTGFETIYSDTDSAFLKIPSGKNQADVEKFTEKINSELPGVMNLELQGFYKRGIFVTKKEGGAAKKRYALLDYNDNLKIVGFEYVRRDWSPIAKETQKKVLEAVLKEGNPQKAIEITRVAIKELKSGKTKKKDLVIYSQIRAKLEDYKAIGPHVAAAIKAVKRGKDIGNGSVIDYIITRSGKSISDKAELAEYVEEGNYDADYYLKHQLIPAVIKIISEFGLTEDDLLQGGKQQSLGGWD